MSLMSPVRVTPSLPPWLQRWQAEDDCKTQPAWLSENGDQLQQAPSGDAKAMILVKNLTKPEADALCPARTKSMPDIPPCKIKTGR